MVHYQNIISTSKHRKEPSRIKLSFNHSQRQICNCNFAAKKEVLPPPRTIIYVLSYLTLLKVFRRRREPQSIYILTKYTTFFQNKSETLDHVNTVKLGLHRLIILFIKKRGAWPPLMSSSFGKMLRDIHKIQVTA